MWLRVFARGRNEVSPAALLQHLHDCGLTVSGRFRGDDLGWTAGELIYALDATPVMVDRYLPKEDDIRDELNAWAAWLETATYSPNHGLLMERVIQTEQLLTIRRPLDGADEVLIDKVCLAVCRFAASMADGIYQIDGQGFFAADGSLLLEEF